MDGDNQDGFDVDKRNILDDCFNHFYSPTPRENILRALWWFTVFSTTVMGSKVVGMRPLSTSFVMLSTFVNMTRSNRETQKI